MNEWLNKPLFSQRYLQTFFLFFSHALLASSPMFSKRTKRKIKHICVQATLIFSIDLWPKRFCNKKKAQFVIFSAEQEFTNSCIENSMSKVEVWGLLDAKRFIDCDYAFSSSTRFQKRKEWICESKSQASDRLQVFAGFFCS